MAVGTGGGRDWPGPGGHTLLIGRRTALLDRVGIVEDRVAPAAADAGLAPDEVADVLEAEASAAEVRADERLARELGINSVPFFAIDRELAPAPSTRT